MLSFIGILPVHFLLQSHPTWVRGLKFLQNTTIQQLPKVAPYLGAWIEISICLRHVQPDKVAPYLGAWIEIFTRCYNTTIT